ncbi:MAG: mechanosensitive ion channel [Ignavibacteria bacterium]|nr:mechanosensitive ion channel [Ignavibacteria bacterium]
MIDQLTQTASDLVAVFGLRVIIAIVIIVFGRWIARWLSNIIKRVLAKREIDPMLVSFAGSFVYMALLTFAILAALSQLGVETTSFVAVIGAAGLAIGLALQGALANFAAGVLIIVFRPFRVGHFIEAAGVSGVIEEIQIFTTKMKTPDNKEVIIPNGRVMSDTITNYSAREQRRIDFVFGIGYGDNIQNAKQVIEKVFDGESRILKDPAPTIGVVELGESSVNIAARPWVSTADYWPVYFDITEKIKDSFDAAGISIPFPQRDIHLFQEKN